MANRLTVKQKKFVKAYVANDGNGTQAALEAYDTTDEKTAGVIAVENLAKPSVMDAIEQALTKHGITIEAATKPIADGLYAFKDDDKPDHPVRLKASGMALKLLGADQGAVKGNTFIFNRGDVVSKKYVKD